MPSREDEDGPAEFLRRSLVALIADLRERRSPVTAVIVAAISLVFVVQGATAVRLGVSVRTVTWALFIEESTAAWLLSFFLHQNVEHALTNVLVIGFVGRVVEREFTAAGYALFAVAAAVVAGAGGYYLRAAFTAEPVVSYGASGLAYALAGYTFTLPFPDRTSPVDGSFPERLVATTTPAERVAATFGVAAVATVAVDVATGPYLAGEWLNGAHLVGLLVGLATAAIHGWNR